MQQQDDIVDSLGQNIDGRTHDAALVSLRYELTPSIFTHPDYANGQLFSLKTMLEFLSLAVEQRFPPITVVYLPTSE
jgi:hypothetical protein